MSDPGALVATRARELASWQCEIEEIAAVIGEETGWPEPQVASWLTRMAGMVTRSRLTARAELRGRVWRASQGIDEMSKEQWAICSELLRQHAGWAKSSTPTDELVRALIKAQRDQDAKGPKLKAVGS